MEECRDRIVGALEWSGSICFAIRPVLTVRHASLRGLRSCVLIVVVLLYVHHVLVLLVLCDQNERYSVRSARSVYRLIGLLLLYYISCGRVVDLLYLPHQVRQNCVSACSKAISLCVCTCSIRYCIDQIKKSLCSHLVILETLHSLLSI